MVDISKGEKRGRGRPLVRCADETKTLIIEAANGHFQEFGFASANINLIAKTAGVSTKTLYKLFPRKSDVFASVVQDRIDRFFLSLDEQAIREKDLRGGLVDLLVAYGSLALSVDTIGINQLVISEAERFPDIAQTFYDKAVVKTNGIFERWLSFHIELGRLKPGDPSSAAGMLRGMMIMEPQRAVFMRQAKPPLAEEIRARALACAELFLDGSRA